MTGVSHCGGVGLRGGGACLRKLGCDGEGGDGGDRKWVGLGVREVRVREDGGIGGGGVDGGDWGVVGLESRFPPLSCIYPENHEASMPPSKAKYTPIDI